jgi:tRNA A37 threonylcarbamoyltransferase TsaD
MTPSRAKKKSSVGTNIRRYAPADVKIPARLGGGVLKELVEQELPSGKLRHYSLAYINPMIFAGDNGRVIGYDNSHGYPHRHFMGEITPEPELSWEDIRARFEVEWREIALKFVNGE